MPIVYKLECKDGTPAEPPIFHTAVPTWGPGDIIPVGRDRTLRVIGCRFGSEPKDDHVLVVEAV